jgi:hypothetical protein
MSITIHHFNTILSGSSVTATLQVCLSVMLLLVIVESEKYKVQVACIGITFIPNFLKVGH